jgi:hypothetical protein
MSDLLTRDGGLQPGRGCEAARARGSRWRRCAPASSALPSPRAASAARPLRPDRRGQARRASPGTLAALVRRRGSATAFVTSSQAKALRRGRRRAAQRADRAASASAATLERPRAPSSERRAPCPRCARTSWSTRTRCGRPAPPGPSGVLLIARMLGDGALDALCEAAGQAELFVIAEAFDADDVRRCARLAERWVGPQPLLIGVNVRDLVTLAVDRHRLASLAPCCQLVCPRSPRAASSGPGRLRPRRVLGLPRGAGRQRADALRRPRRPRCQPLGAGRGPAPE